MVSYFGTLRYARRLTGTRTRNRVLGDLRGERLQVVFMSHLLSDVSLRPVYRHNPKEHRIVY